MRSWNDRPEPAEPVTLEPTEAGPTYPNLGERVIRIVLHVVAIITMALAALLMLTFIRIGAQIGDAVDRVRAPDPLVTGCPFGDEECGG